MSDLVFEPAWRLAQRIAAREVSCEDLMRAHLDRIQSVNRAINAVVEVYAEEALATARRMDRQMPSDVAELPPFYGVPMTVKGAWDCAGFVNTGGTMGRKGFVSQHDATVIGRMRAAGMIPLGVTNLPEFSMAFESDNLVYGRSSNPYALSCTAGGSGGGGGAAIASGCSPFEVGGDLGGSIRVPCHFNGIAGLKPTLGRIPLTGYFPGPFGITTLLATAGPMARTVKDLVLTYPLLCGPDFFDGTVADAVVRSPDEVDLGSLRIAFHTENGVFPCSPETAATVTKAAEAMHDVAAVVQKARPEQLEESYEIMLGLLGADGGAGFEELIAVSNTSERSPFLCSLLDMLQPMTLSSAQFGSLLVRRDLYRSRVARFFGSYDAILCPAAGFPAPPHGHAVANVAAFSYTMAHNVSGCPGVVVRCGTSSDGLPIAVQVVAGPWQEHIALKVASHLETVFGGWSRPQI
jgi:amidase